MSERELIIRQREALEAYKRDVADEMGALRVALRGLLDASQGADFTDQRSERAFNAAVDFARATLTLMGE